MDRILNMIRFMRLEATKLYNECKFEDFKVISARANVIEHNYKIATQEDIS